MEGHALRFVAPRRVDVHRVEVRPPTSNEVLIRTRWSGISGGTELLAYRGELDPEQSRDEVIAGLDGTFRYPFAYGYSCVGVIERSLADGLSDGDLVFAFHPHQDLLTAPAGDVVPVDGLDARIATLFPLVETALQVTLDAGSRLDETVVVLGMGPVGILSAALLDRSGAKVMGVDPREDRCETAQAFGVRAVAPGGVESIVHASTDGAGASLLVDATGHPAALRHGLPLLRHEGEALICSWYGNKDVPIPLGADFHRRRLQIRSTQVSTIPSSLAARWDVARRRRVAMRLASDLPLKALATHEFPFRRAAEAYSALDRAEHGVVHVALRYE